MPRVNGRQHMFRALYFNEVVLNYINFAAKREFRLTATAAHRNRDLGPRERYRATHDKIDKPARARRASRTFRLINLALARQCEIRLFKCIREDAASFAAKTDGCFNKNDKYTHRRVPGAATCRHRGF